MLLFLKAFAISAQAIVDMQAVVVDFRQGPSSMKTNLWQSIRSSCRSSSAQPEGKSAFRHTVGSESRSDLH